MRSGVLLSLFWLATLAALAAGAAGADYKVVETWKLGGDEGWDYLTADGDGHRLFIARTRAAESLKTGLRFSA